VPKGTTHKDFEFFRSLFSLSSLDFRQRRSLAWLSPWLQTHNSPSEASVTSTTPSTLSRFGPDERLMTLWTPCLLIASTVAILAWSTVYSPAQPVPQLQRMSLALALTTIIAVAGLLLRKAWALWLTLIVVSFAATLDLFLWSMNFRRILVALSVAVLCAISVLIFRLGPSLGREVGVYQRILFAFVLSFAAWVAYWGLFRPLAVARAIPFPVAPLHARFLGAMYFSGAIFMLLGMLVRQWHDVRVVTLILSVWTGLLGIVSLFHLDAFNWSRDQVWFWFLAYICFPLVALWVAWCQRGENDHPGEPEITELLRSYLYLQGGVAIALALPLLFAPHFMTTMWPWKIPVAVANIYGAPFLSYGIGGLYAARQRSWSEVRIIIFGTFVFAVGVLIASKIHVQLFDFRTPSAWIWFGGFGFVSVALLLFSSLPSFRTRS